MKQLFPPDPITGDYIDIIRLRPKLTDNSECEHIKFEASLLNLIELFFFIGSLTNIENSPL